MIVTQLEGKVGPEHWATLKQAFAEQSQPLPPAIVHSYLIQDQSDPDIWRVLTIWRSREALQDYRDSVETPGGVLMFRAAGAEPALSISEVIVHARSGGAEREQTPA